METKIIMLILQFGYAKLFLVCAIIQSLIFGGKIGGK